MFFVVTGNVGFRGTTLGRTVAPRRMVFASDVPKGKCGSSVSSFCRVMI